MREPVHLPLSRDVILYEDADLLAAEKPCGISTIPERDLSRISLKIELERICGAPLWVVHRLDKEVSGVILFAKNAAAHRHLNLQFADRAVAKRYVALAHGRITSDAGDIDISLREFGSGRMGVDPRRGKPCRTEYRVVERFERFTLVEASPWTGRRHQLRVHFFALGHPLVGDPRYGDPAIQTHYPRLLLHARQIEFTTPDGQRCCLESREAEPFLQLCRQWGRAGSSVKDRRIR